MKKNIGLFIVFLVIGLTWPFLLKKLALEATSSPINNTEIKSQNAEEKHFQQIMTYAIASNLSSLPIGEILQSISEQFLGAKYQAGLLDSFKQETLFISLEKFDCVLFVETVLALARNIANKDYQYETFANNILNLRYVDGKINGYCSRLHYFSEWIEDNEKRGNVKNITPQLGGITVKKTLNFMSTHRNSYPKMENNEANYQCILQMESNLNNLNFNYIPTKQIKNIYSKLQQGDIIGVATNIPGLDFTHTGLVYRTVEGNIGIIHASPAGEVTIAGDLQDYVSKIDNSIGIVVVRPSNPRQN